MKNIKKNPFYKEIFKKEKRSGWELGLVFLFLILLTTIIVLYG